MPDEFEKFLKQRHTTANPDTQRQAIEKGASDLGIDPVDYATAMAYESGGTFDPWQKGPVTKWGQHRGTIQYGEPQQKQYGVFPGQSFEDQVTNSNVKYLKDKGVQPGMGFDQVYAAINGGSVRKNLATQDANTGRTIADNIRNAQQQYRDKVLQRFWGGQEPQDEFAQFKQSQQPDDFQQFLADTPQQPQPPTNPANVMVQPQALPEQPAPQVTPQGEMPPVQIEGMAPIAAPNATPQGMPPVQQNAPQQAVTPPVQQNAVVAPVNAQNAPVDEEAAKANALMQQQTQAKVANIQKVLKPSAKQGKQYEFQKTGTLTLPPIMGQSAGEVLTYQPDAELEKGGEYKVTDADGNSYTYVPSTGKIAPEAGGAILRDVAVPLGDPNANVNTVKQTQGATIASAIADMLPDVPQQDIVDFFVKKGLSHFDTQQNLTDPEYLKGFVNPVTGTTDAPTTVPYHVTQRGLNQIEAYAKDKADERAKYNDAYKQAVSEGDDPFTASISAKVATNQISAKKGDEIIAAQRPNSPENLRAMAIAAIRQENAPTMGSGKTDAHSNFGEKYEPTEDEIKAKVAELGSPEAIASRERIQQDAANIAANLKSDGLLGQAKLGLQAVGGNLEALAGAALRPFSSVPGLSDLYKTATEKSQARAIAFEHGGDNTWAGFGLRHGVKVAGDLVELALLSKVPGLKGNMPLTFAVQGAATTAGQGGSAVDTTKAFTSGYVLGKIFDGATKAESLVANVGKKAVVTEEVGNNAFLNNIWKGLSQEEKDAQIALMKDTTMSTADKRFLLLNNLVSKMAGGTVIVGGTAGLGKAEGNSNASIAGQVATNLFFHFGPSAIQGAVKISSKGYAMVRGKGDVTPDVLDKISGRVARVWEDGKPHHYFVDNKGQLNKTARPVPQGLVEMETVADPKNPVYKQQTAEGKAKARELPLPDTTQKPIDTKAEDAPLTQRGEDRRKQASSDYADNERRSAERRVKEETLSTISPEQVLNLAGDKKINDATLDATIEKVTGKKSLMDLSKQELLDVSDELRTNPEVSSQSVGEKVQDTKGSDVPAEKGFEMKPTETADITDSKGNIDYDKITDVAKRIERGESTLGRLNPEVERGRVAGGQRNVEASLVLAADERANQKASAGDGSRMDSHSNTIKPKQAESLESPDTHEIKDEGASLKDLEAELKGETPSKATEPTTGLTEGSKFTNVSTGKEGELYNDPKLGWRLKTGENSSTTFPNRFWSAQDHIARTDDILASDKTPEQKAREIINNEESVNTQSNSANERTPEARPNSESSGGDKVVTPKPVERPSEELPSEVNAKGVTAEKPIEEGGTDGGKLNEAGVQPKSAETPKELELFKNNKIVTADRVAKIRAEIAKRQGKLTSGIDPVDLALYTELGAAYVEAGARKFADFSKQMIDDLGDEVRPHLDKIYGNVRKHFDFDGMTPDTRTPLEEGKGVAKVGKSIQQKAIEQGLVDEFSDTARYDIKGVEEQAKQVSDLVTSDQPRALRIIRGEEQLPDSINRSMFIDGVERYVKGMDDTVAAGKIISDLMNSDLVTDTSKAAQTLRFLQEREPDSVTAYLKQVQDARKAAAKRQGVSSEDVKALDNRINELEKQLAEKQKASIDKQFEQFINEVKSDQTAAKKKGGSVVDYFNELEAKARARIDKRGESAIFRSSVNPIDPQMLADHAIIGAAHIARGVKRGVEFGDAMVKQFGEKIRPYLDDLWDASDRFYKANATKSKADLTPEQIVASSDGVDRNLINSLVSARVKRGDTSVDNVFSEVTKDIQSKYPEVSEREIRDTFTGYGENKEPTRNDLLRQRNVVRRLAKLQSELEDVRNGKAPWKAEHQGQTKSEYVLAKERELEEAMAKAGIPLRAVKSDAERLGMRKKAMQNELRKIERNLSNGNFAKPERRSIPLDPEGAAIQKELTRAREARNNLGYTTSPEEAETLLHLLKAVDEGRTAMAAGGDPKTTYGVAQVALNNYVNDLKLEAKRYKMADFKANPAGFVAHVLNEAASNTKAIAASMDDSAVFRQGWKVMFTNPTIWAKNGVKSFAHLIKMRGQHEVMDALNADIVSRPTYDLMKKAKLDIGVNEETFPTTLPEHIPIFGRVYKATENAYTAFVRKTRADVFDKYIDIANKTGVELTDTELRGIGRMVNSLTGRGDLGTLEQAGKVVNNVFFSPKFLKSHFDVLGGHIITGGGEGSNFVRKQAAINMLKVVGGTAAILAIAKVLNPDSVDLDPRSSDFGKIRVGNTTFDVSGGMGSILTLAARMALSQTKSSVTGKIYQLGETDKNGKLKFGAQTRFDVFLNFFTNKLSPLAGAMRDYYKGQTFDNENPTMMRLTEGLLTPLPVKTAQELWQDPNSAPFLEGLLADFMGISTNTYGGSKGVLRDMQKAKVRGDQKEVERLKPILQEERKIEAAKLKRKKAELSNK